MISKPTSKLAAILKTEIPLSGARRFLAHDLQNPFPRFSKATRRRLAVVFAYLALIFISLPVPLLHSYRTDRAIESMRPVMRLDDGTYTHMLLPSEFLFLRWCGQISWMLVYVVVLFFLLSFVRDVFARFSTICAVAICLCAFTALYAFYATLLLGFALYHPAA
jgi:hypothetical protein